MQFLHIFWGKITLNELFWEILNAGKGEIFSRFVFEIYKGNSQICFGWNTFIAVESVGAYTWSVIEFKLRLVGNSYFRLKLLSKDLLH